ncbi:hypothetical protein NLO95_09545 [Pseudomonas syringae]|nr:hypothetical protein [Pseudomonas syringae]
MDFPKSVPNVGLVNGKFVDENPPTGQIGSLIPAAWGNAVTQEILNVIQDAGTAPNENDNTQLQSAMRKVGAGVVGQVRNLKMQLTAASASATLSADEIIVETALGGLRYCVPRFNNTINLATVGVGGMDTGLAPANSFVGLYAIYNPTTKVSALLAVTASGVNLSSVYSGVNMPAGFTASALVSVWPTNSGSLFSLGYQTDRTIAIAHVTVFNSSSGTGGSQVSLNISSAVPLNAKFINGYISVSSTTLGDITLGLYPSTITGGGGQGFAWGGAPAGKTQTNGFASLQVAVPGVIGLAASTSGGGTPSYFIAINSYDF